MSNVSSTFVYHGHNKIHFKEMMKMMSALY